MNSRQELDIIASLQRGDLVWLQKQPGTYANNNETVQMRYDNPPNPLHSVHRYRLRKASTAQNQSKFQQLSSINTLNSFGTLPDTPRERSIQYIDADDTRMQKLQTFPETNIYQQPSRQNRTELSYQFVNYEQYQVQSDQSRLAQNEYNISTADKKSENQNASSSSDNNDPKKKVTFIEPTLVLNAPSTLQKAPASQILLDSDLEQKMKDLFEGLNENLSKWELTYDKNDLKLYRKFEQGNPSVIVQARAIMRKCEVDTVFDCIYNGHERAKWDKVFNDFSRIQLLSENQEIAHYHIDTGVPLMAQRDFVEKRGVKRDYPQKGQISQVSYSVEHPQVPPNKKYVRGQTKIAGQFLQKLNQEDTFVQILVCSDIGGSVPKSVVNIFAERSPIIWIDQLREHLKKKRRKNLKSKLASSKHMQSFQMARKAFQATVKSGTITSLITT